MDHRQEKWIYQDGGWTSLPRCHGTGAHKKWSGRALRKTAIWSSQHPDGQQIRASSIQRPSFDSRKSNLCKKKIPNYKHFFFNLANIYNQAVPKGIPLHAVIVFQSNPPSKLLQHKNCQSVRSSLSYQSSNANGASEEGSNPIIQSQLLPTVCLGPGGWIS